MQVRNFSGAVMEIIVWNYKTPQVETVFVKKFESVEIVKFLRYVMEMDRRFLLSTCSIHTLRVRTNATLPSEVLADKF